MTNADPELLNARINLQDAQTQREGEFPPIPEGVYETKVIDAKMEYSKKGAPMYVLTLEIANGEYRGRRFWHRRPILSKVAGFIKGDFEALGLKLPGDSSALDVARYAARESFGRMVTAKIGFGTGDYEDRNEVKGLIPSGATAVAEPVLLDE